MVVLDADLSGSTYTGKFAKAYPERFFNMGIAEQNMISTAAGLAAAGKVPFASSFAMFATGRAWEQVRNSVAHNEFNVKVAATHAGITLGEDGASHQIIEDIALMGVIPKMSVLVPADATETREMVKFLVKHNGPAYLRLGRPAVPVLFDKNTYKYEYGKAQIISSGSDVTIIGVGVMVSKALEAAEQLKLAGINAEVINLSTIKPLDEETIVKSVEKTGCAVVAEEHNKFFGVNSVVSACISRKVNKFVPLEAVAIEDRFGQSGTMDALMKEYGLTAENILEKSKLVISKKTK